MPSPRNGTQTLERTRSNEGSYHSWAAESSATGYINAYGWDNAQGNWNAEWSQTYSNPETQSAFEDEDWWAGEIGAGTSAGRRKDSLSEGSESAYSDSGADRMQQYYRNLVSQQQQLAQLQQMQALHYGQTGSNRDAMAHMMAQSHHAAGKGMKQSKGLHSKKGATVAKGSGKNGKAGSASGKWSPQSSVSAASSPKNGKSTPRAKEVATTPSANPQEYLRIKQQRETTNWFGDADSAQETVEDPHDTTVVFTNLPVPIYFREQEFFLGKVLESIGEDFTQGKWDTGNAMDIVRAHEAAGSGVGNYPAWKHWRKNENPQDSVLECVVFCHKNAYVKFASKELAERCILSFQNCSPEFRKIRMNLDVKIPVAQWMRFVQDFKLNEVPQQDPHCPLQKSQINTNNAPLVTHLATDSMRLEYLNTAWTDPEKQGQAITEKREELMAIENAYGKLAVHYSEEEGRKLPYNPYSYWAIPTATKSSWKAKKGVLAKEEENQQPLRVLSDMINENLGEDEKKLLSHKGHFSRFWARWRVRADGDMRNAVNLYGLTKESFEALHKWNEGWKTGASNWNNKPQEVYTIPEDQEFVTLSFAYSLNFNFMIDHSMKSKFMFHTQLVWMMKSHDLGRNSPFGEFAFGTYGKPSDWALSTGITGANEWAQKEGFATVLKQQLKEAIEKTDEEEQNQEGFLADIPSIRRLWNEIWAKWRTDVSESDKAKWQQREGWLLDRMREDWVAEEAKPLRVGVFYMPEYENGKIMRPVVGVELQERGWDKLKNTYNRVWDHHFKVKEFHEDFDVESMPAPADSAKSEKKVTFFEGVGFGVSIFAITWHDLQVYVHSRGRWLPLELEFDKEAQTVDQKSVAIYDVQGWTIGDVLDNHEMFAEHANLTMYNEFRAQTSTKLAAQPTEETSLEVKAINTRDIPSATNSTAVSETESEAPVLCSMQSALHTSPDFLNLAEEIGEETLQQVLDIVNTKYIKLFESSVESTKKALKALDMSNDVTPRSTERICSYAANYGVSCGILFAVAALTVSHAGEQNKRESESTNSLNESGAKP